MKTALKPVHLRTHYSNTLDDGRRRDAPNRGLSAWTLRKHHVIMREALAHAVKWGIIGRNVALAVDPPKPRKQPAYAMDSEAAHSILTAAQGTVWHPIFHLALFTGLRKGKVLGLRWRDVDLDLAELYIIQTLQKQKGREISFQEPKTNGSRRPVVLSPVAAKELRAYKEKQESNLNTMGDVLTPKTLVFERADGTIPSPDSVTHAFAKFARRVGVLGVRFHDLRHTHASLMLKSGVHPKIVSERLGHSSVSITLDVYSHVVPGHQQAAAKTFDETL
jgi:integrase